MEGRAAATVPEHSVVGVSKGTLCCREHVKRVPGMIVVPRSTGEANSGIMVTSKTAIIGWLVEWIAQLSTLYSGDAHGQCPYQKTRWGAVNARTAKLRSMAS